MTYYLTCKGDCLTSLAAELSGNSNFDQVMSAYGPVASGNIARV